MKYIIIRRIISSHTPTVVLRKDFKFTSDFKKAILFDNCQQALNIITVLKDRDNLVAISWVDFKKLLESK